MEKQRDKEPVPWSKVYPDYLKEPGAPTCNQAFDLLGKMLQFDLKALFRGGGARTPVFVNPAP